MPKETQLDLALYNVKTALDLLRVRGNGCKFHLIGAIDHLVAEQKRQAAIIREVEELIKPKTYNVNPRHFQNITGRPFSFSDLSPIDRGKAGMAGLILGWLKGNGKFTDNHCFWRSDDGLTKTKIPREKGGGVS